MEYEMNQFVRINETGEIGQIKEITYHSADYGKPDIELQLYKMKVDNYF